jgi:hypothetical protein
LNNNSPWGPTCVLAAAIVIAVSASPAAEAAMSKRDQLLEWARSSEAADHSRLRSALTDRATLRELDKEFVPNGRRGAPRQSTPYDEILGALAANPAPGARDAFSALVADPKFAQVAADSPLDPLTAAVHATASLRSPGRPIVDFWRKLSAPDAGYAPAVFDALIANGSPQAAELAATLAASKRYPADEVVSWIRASLTPRRTNEAALAAAERLLKSAAVSKEAKSAVLEALFARDVSAWFTPATWPGALPDPAAASAAAREARARIAREALAGASLPGPLRADVETASAKP